MDIFEGTYKVNEGFDWSKDCQNGSTIGGNNVAKQEREADVEHVLTGVSGTFEDSIEKDVEDLSDTALIYNVSDSPPIHLSIIFGFQQALLSLSGNLTVSLLIAEVICAETDEEIKAKLLGTTLFMSGVTTLLMTFVGTRLPLFQGAAGDYVIPLLVMVAIDKDRCDLDPELGSLLYYKFFIKIPGRSYSRYHVSYFCFYSKVARLQEEALLANDTIDMIAIKRPMVMTNIQSLQGSLILAGLIHCLIGSTGLVGILLRFIGPVTIVPAILLIGIYIVRATVTFAKVQWGISFMTCAISLILALYMSKLKLPFPVWTRKHGCYITRYPFHQMFAILIAILIGWAVCGILTVTDVIADDKNSTSYYTRTDARSHILTTAKWFHFPYPGQFGPIDFSVSVFLGFMIATFTSILDSIGDYYACASMCRVPPPPSHAVNRGIAIEGFCSAIAGLLGCGHATTTYGGNIGAIGVTRVSSRHVFFVTGMIYVIFGIIGKISAVFICIPYPVLGGALITMFGMFTGVVLSNLKVIDLSSSRNLAIIGTAIFAGLMVPYWIETFPKELQTGNAKADEIFKILLGNPNMFGGVLACILDNTVPGTIEERGIATWQNVDDPENTTYVEGPEIYTPPLTARMRKSKILRFIPFLPDPTT